MAITAGIMLHGHNRPAAFLGNRRCWLFDTLHLQVIYLNTRLFSIAAITYPGSAINPHCSGISDVNHLGALHVAHLAIETHPRIHATNR